MFPWSTLRMARIRYQNILRKVIKIQAVRRGVLGRRYAKEHRRHVSAARLQSLVRTRREQRIYDALRQSIVFAQQRLRMRNAKGQLKKLKQEAKEVGAMMAKAQKAQEQASEMRKHNEEMEAHQLQLQSENKTLSNKVKHLEEMLQQMQQQFEDMKAQAAEAAKLAADQSKTVVEAEKMEGLNSQLSQRDEELAGLRKELQEMKETHTKQQESLKSAEANYQQLLRSTAMQSVGASAGAPAPVARSAARGNRNVFIQLVSGTRWGKSRAQVALRAVIAVQRPVDESAGKLSAAFPPWLIVTNVLTEAVLKPGSMSGNPSLQHPRWAAYMTGIMEFTLLRMLGRTPEKGLLYGYRQLDHAAVECAAKAIVGASATIATATPVIIQWAKCHDFKALLQALVLGVYAMFVGDVLSRKVASDSFRISWEEKFPYDFGLHLHIRAPAVATVTQMAESFSMQLLNGWPAVFTKCAKVLPFSFTTEELDFVVVSGSMVCGHTLRSAGFMNSKEVLIQRISRLQSLADDAHPEIVSHLTAQFDLDDWCLEVDDIITDVLQRVFAACDCTAITSWADDVTRGSVTGQRAGWKELGGAAGAARALARGIKKPGDTLVCANVQRVSFGRLASRGAASRPLPGYVVTRFTPVRRGVLAIVAFITAMVLDSCLEGVLARGAPQDNWQRTDRRDCDMSSIAKVEEILDWNSCLTIGCGEAIFIAIRRSGYITFSLRLVTFCYNGPGLVMALAKLIAQIGAIGGLLIANAALVTDSEYHQLNSEIWKKEGLSHLTYAEVGAAATGKTTMLGSLIQENDPGQMSNFEEQRNNLMVHHQFQISGRPLKFLDCSGNDRAAHLVKEWFARTQWVFVVYNLTDTRSYEKALTLVTEARQAGASVVLFANKFDVNQGKPVEVPCTKSSNRILDLLLSGWSIKATTWECV
ncbi:Myosin-14 [Symbiodinium microadriaticum]|uniref:Myosin-14 n=1 Tax=Symbiodinium microadriaticum TaxID=2951 RepID=A0A1Q9ET13_SYMMI|nr:Myosin-14 [Symbiodinium microadriaticum]